MELKKQPKCTDDSVKFIKLSDSFSDNYIILLKKKSFKSRLIPNLYLRAHKGIYGIENLNSELQKIFNNYGKLIEIDYKNTELAIILCEPKTHIMMVNVLQMAIQPLQ